MRTALQQDLIKLVGAKGVVSNAAEMAPFLAEERGLYQGRCELVICPTSTEEVSKVVSYCASRNIPITPQGGNTGTVGGSSASGGILISLKRMTTIIEIDPVNRTVTVNSGCILATLQRAVSDQGLMFPVSLGAEGTCHVGGILSTNAGGVNVLRYGNAADQVLGLEVVLPDGQVWNGLRGLRKDNTGYDLKRLFCGAEGTLGVITTAVLKLHNAPKTTVTLMVATSGYRNALAVFNRMQNSFDSNLSAAELISNMAMEFVARHIPGLSNPFSEIHHCYVLFELTSARADVSLRSGAEAVLESAFETGLVDDAVFAESQAQAATLWSLRETISESQKSEGGSIKHDVAVPVSKLAEFMERADAVVREEDPDIRICAFGHMGDGNIHYNLSQPVNAKGKEFVDQWGHFSRLVHDLTVSLGGSFSAEHGIGQLKLQDMERYKQPLELELMKKIKLALDPCNRMNPGKVVRFGKF
jgi:FAD/FMN-containing dehydrogenase